MSQTETKLLRKTKTRTLDLAELKTVKWVAGIDAVNNTYGFSRQKYDTAKRIPLINWIIATIEMFVISIYLFIHSLPWPNWALEIIHKIDRIIEQILEAISNKVEWWWDIFVIRLMWFRDSVETIIDTFLSLSIFIAYKVVEFWLRIFYFWLSVVKFIFSPVIWVVKSILPPPTETPDKIEKTEKKKLSSSPTPVNDNSFNSGATNSHHGMKENETEEAHPLSGTTSECDSDISAVSEAWSIGHTDKHGKSYNRLEMKATAEGKLRAAMYKRVKAQLTLMRKNSINFSKGMTSYAREYVIPRVEPTLTAIIKWIHNLAEKYGFADIFDQIVNRMEKHYILSTFVSFGLYIILIPIKILNEVLFKEKKKSRRTRSMRSESLRRRTGAGAAVVSPSVLETYGLKQSKEPVVVEEPEFCNLTIDEKPPTVEEDSLRDTVDKDDDAMRDSALASSVDDLYHMSDSNDGSNSLKDQTIQEEDDKEEEIKAKSTPKENGILKTVNKSNQTKIENKKDKKETQIEKEISKEPNNEINKEIKREIKREIKKEVKKEIKKEIKKETQNNVETKHEPVTSNNVRPKQLAIPQLETEKPQSPQQTRKKSLKDTSRSGSEEGLNTIKSPKRKISFSLS